MNPAATWDDIEGETMPPKKKTWVERLTPWLAFIVVGCTALNLTLPMIRTAGNAISLADTVKVHTDQIGALQRGQEAFRGDFALLRKDFESAQLAAKSSDDAVARQLDSIDRLVRDLAAETRQIGPQVTRAQSEALAAKEKAANALVALDDIREKLSKGNP